MNIRITIKTTRLQHAAQVFADADDAWGMELRRIFGKDAHNARYRAIGKGAPHSQLRKLHDQRAMALMQWEMARQDHDAGKAFTNF